MGELRDEIHSRNKVEQYRAANNIGDIDWQPPGFFYENLFLQRCA
jgi:hypothetical protein